MDEYKGNRLYGGTTTIPSSVVKVDVRGTTDRVSRSVRSFREKGSLEPADFKRLLVKIREDCAVPKYQPNWPRLILHEQKKKKGSVRIRGSYIPGWREINIYGYPTLKVFLFLWHEYLEARNFGFVRVVSVDYCRTAHNPSYKYALEVIKNSTPRRIINLENRSFVETREL